MSKKLQLKSLVVLSLLVIIVIYLYVNRGFSFNFDESFKSLKDSVETNMSELLDPEIIEDLQNNFSNLKEKITDNQKNVEFQITEKVLDRLSPSNYVVYEYEPWGIKFNYDSLMTKEIDQDNETFLLSYDNIQDVYLTIKKISLEENFNDWLNNNYDLQTLNKYENNGLVFWTQDLSDDENKIEEYYLNRGEDLFIFSLNCSKEKEDNYWSALKNVIKSFDLIENINL